MATTTVTRTLDASPERSWQALVSPASLAAWFWPASFDTRVTLDPRPGGRLLIEAPSRGIGVDGQIVEVTPNRRLATSWSWTGEPGASTVTIDLAPADDGTLLTVTHDGLADDPEALDHQRGWNDCLDRLVAYLSRPA